MTALVESGSGYRVTLRRVVRAEWTKLRSLRSTWIVFGAAAVLTVAIAGAIGWNAERDRQGPPTAAEAVGGAFLGVDLISLVFGVFGILLMTSEYGSGSIRATLAAVPRRLPVLWAKALALVTATVPVMAAVSLSSFLLSQAFVDAGQRVTLGDPEVLRASLGAVAAPVAAGLLGLGLGAMLRHTAAAITTFVVALLVLPGLLPFALPDSMEREVGPYSPVAASQAMYAIDGGGQPFETLSPGPAALVTCGWVGLALAGGAIVLRRRDA
jgi:ABC-2 type transport system permease protein